MVVLYILDYGTVGGATKAFVTLIKHIRCLGVVPIVITGKYNELNDYFASIGVETIAAGHYTAIESISFKSFYWPYSYLKRIIRYHIAENIAIKRIEKTLDLSKIDIIHTNSARNTLGARLSKKYRIPHIVHIREFGDKDFCCVKLTPNYLNILNH